MRPHQYKELMGMLNNAVENGYEDEIIVMPPYLVLDEIIDLTGTRTLDDVPEEEIIRCIQEWQERQADL